MFKISYYYEYKLHHIANLALGVGFYYCEPSRKLNLFRYLGRGHGLCNNRVNFVLD